MISYQTEMMMTCVGDMWFDKNRDDLWKRDPITPMIEDVGLKPFSILEIGCANGIRLKKLRDKYKCNISGIDISGKAVAAANDKDIIVGRADDLPYDDKSFDLVIMGFFLYSVAPEDWFMVAAEANRVLSDGGHMAIWDFTTARIFKQRMVLEEHSPVWMYFYDWPSLWTHNPRYITIHERHYLKDMEMVTLLKKKPDDSIPIGSL